MDSVNKRKIIIVISVIALLVLGAIVVFATLPNGTEDTEELSVRVQDEGDVTVDKMMEAGENKQGEMSLQQPNAEMEIPAHSVAQTSEDKEQYKGMDSYSTDETPEVMALQKQLRSNRKTSSNDGYSAPVRSGCYGSTPSYDYSSNRGYSSQEETHSSKSVSIPSSTPAPMQGQVMTTSPVTSTPTTTIQKPRGRFFSTVGKKGSVDNAISAVVHGNQAVTNGSTLKMHLDQDMSVNGKVIPKNTFVFGVVTFAGERMNVRVTSIRLANSIYPVSLDVYDRDGIKGIYVPGNVKADVKGEATEAGANEISSSGTGILGGVTRVVTSVGKAIFSKKAKEQKAMVRTNYKIYLQWKRD